MDSRLSNWFEQILSGGSKFWWSEEFAPLLITNLGWLVMVECELAHLWSDITHSKGLLIQVASLTCVNIIRPPARRSHVKITFY